MYRFLIYIFTFSLLNLSCTHFEKNTVVAIDPLAPTIDFTPPELALITHRGISAEASSLDAEFRKLKTADELEALITKIDTNYAAIADTEKFMALELSLLKPFRGYNVTLNQISIGMSGTDLLKMVIGLDATNWKKNPAVNSYLSDKKVRRLTKRDDVQEHLSKELVPRMNKVFRLVAQLTSKTYKTEFCQFSCAKDKTVPVLQALETMALVNAKLSFQLAYKYTGIFNIRKSSKSIKAMTANTESIDTDPNILATTYTEMELRNQTRDVSSAFGISTQSTIWLKYAYDWYKMYVSIAIKNDPNKANILAKAFLGDQPHVYQGQPIIINIASLFDKPNPDLKNFLASKFNDRSKKPTEWDIDSYKAIFPYIRSNDEVPIYVNALAEYFPGGLPFPLQVVFKPTAIKAKK
ncbi:MAG: hypothetical protein JNM24_18120 [Bdellovibrionaceae bacterium]|nr:hypothetical protein [Pseudobdellovibrionaceae bacterium]